MKRLITITFKSYPELFEKEKSGIKSNIVREFDCGDSREHFLQGIITGEFKKEDVTLKIMNSETGETFEREISDVTYWEFFYIISWRG